MWNVECGVWGYNNYVNKYLNSFKNNFRISNRKFEKTQKNSKIL